MAEASLPAFLAFNKLGIAIAAMIAMIATTIMSSIRVKPFEVLLRASFNEVNEVMGVLLVRFRRAVRPGYLVTFSS